MPKMSPIKLVMLSVSGALGTLARYGLSNLARVSFKNANFPWPTLLVNVLGSFFFGVVFALVRQKNLISEETSFYVLTGFMGAFTTFSTFIFETGKLYKQYGVMWASANIALEILLGIFFLYLGYSIGKSI